MRKKMAAVAFFGAIAVAQPGSAQTTIDFQDVTSGSCNWVGSALNSRGFVFGGNPIDPNLFVCNANTLQHNSSAALLNANQTSIITFSQANGQAFSLNSFFAGTRTAYLYPDQQQYYYGLTTGLDVVGQLAGGGSVSTTFALDGLNWDEFFLPSSFTGLSSVTIRALGQSYSVGPEFLIDDIVVNGSFAQPSGPVPEASTWAMMMLGLGSIGAAMRNSRRRTKGVARFA